MLYLALDSLHLYQDTIGCFTINILPSFAESRQMKVLRGILFARVAMRTAVAQTDKSICLFAMRLLRVETKSNLLATLIGCRADFHLFLLFRKIFQIFLIYSE